MLSYKYLFFVVKVKLLSFAMLLSGNFVETLTSTSDSEPKHANECSTKKQDNEKVYCPSGN